ncbi:MAG: hypothetical protein GY765_22310 [bacterium]|nr:hypothetical protein [bacterium]
MKFKFFAVPAVMPQEAEAEVNRFCSNKMIASVEKQFVAAGDSSFWALCLSYTDGEKKISVSKGKVDYREILNEEEFAVFAKLRTLRKNLSERDGVPAYVLFTNEQFAEMVRNRISTPAGLSTVTGVGKSRITKYGTDLLVILKEAYRKKDMERLEDGAVETG